ncbi:MAG: 30S ribosome-binding factor RbfA [Gammaproteobacteria bacterium]|nr:30S ribosome-binding factor RbfA [Gammaproteobacteria bacterium]
MAQGNRMDRVAGLVQTTLADVLLKEAEDKRFNMVTITSVSLAKDMSSAKVFVSVWDDAQSKEIVAALNKAAAYLRYALAQTKIEIRVIPQLKFVYDDSTARGSRISSLLNQALKDTKPDENE